jgi:hypothetical protein
LLSQGIIITEKEEIKKEQGQCEDTGMTLKKCKSDAAPEKYIM